MDASRRIHEAHLTLPLLLILVPSVYSSHINSGCLHSPDESTVYSKDQMKHSEANHWIKRQCESGRLHTCVSPDNSTQYDQLHGSRVWLDITRKAIPWQWVDGTPAKSNPFHKKRKHRKRHEGKKRCALLHAGEGSIMPYYCFTNKPAALCQLPANKICNAETSWCEEIKGSCFCVIKSHHWYHARASCEEIGGLLSILPYESLRKDIAQVMRKRPPKLVINWLWIGLHGEDWIERSGPRKGQPAETALFVPVPEKERDGRKNCAVANTTGTAETWYAVSCHEKHKVLGICPKNQEPMRADPTSHTSVDEGPKDHTLENRVLSSSASFTVGSAVVSSPTVFIILIGGLCQGIQK